jgi:hypothetical protein
MDGMESRMNNPPLLSDLVPRRNVTYSYLFAGGVSIILCLGALYWLGFRLAQFTTDGQVAAFDLDHEGSIASWFSITLLFLCGSTTLLIRALRHAAGCSSRERRVWLLVSLLWFCMSLDEGASLHEGFKEAVAKLAGSRLFGDGSIYWAVPYFMLLSAAGLFLLGKTWRNLPSIVCLLSAGIAYGLAAVGQLDLILAGRPILETWLEESCEMLGDLCILFCLLLHARSIVSETEPKPVGRTGRRPFQQSYSSRNCLAEWREGITTN